MPVVAVPTTALHRRSLVAVLALLASAAPAATAGAADYTPVASAASSGGRAQAAVDGRTSTRWTASKRGRSWWSGTLAGGRSVDAIQLRGTDPRRTQVVKVSTDGRRFTTVGRRRGGSGWQTVAFAARTVRVVRVETTGSGVGRIAEVRVRLATAAPATPKPGTPQPTTPRPVPTPPATPAPTPKPAPAEPTPKPAEPEQPGEPTPPAEPEQPSEPAPDPEPEQPTDPEPPSEPEQPTDPEPETPATFAGVVTNPIDPAYQTMLRFGDRSHWIQPWRGYLDTMPADRLRDAVGINFNVGAGDAAAAARVLGASGFRRARIEIGWGALSYADPGAIVDEASYATKLRALRDNGIRPLILLNSNDGRPCPVRDERLQITQPVATGARTVQLSGASAARVIPGRTGFNVAKAADVLITAVDASNRATLSKPVEGTVPAGTYDGATLMYRPFTPVARPDGRASSESAETLSGWLDYVDTVTRRVKAILGSSEFDVEIWNEFTFGASFLDANQYYATPQYNGVIDDGVILQRTVERIKAPGAGLDGVRIGTGFSNQRPWDSGETIPAGVDALGKHLYPQNRRFPDATELRQRPLDATGAMSGTQTSASSWVDGFAPTYDSFFPEQPLSGIVTETMVRDISPLTTVVPDPAGRQTKHGRNAGTKPELWMTEFNLHTPFAAELGESFTRADEEHLRAKSTLRALTAFVNKGVTQLDFYAATTDEWGLIGGDFWSRLRSEGAYPGDTAGGPALNGVRRLVGALGNDRITQRRALTLDRIGDFAGNTQFAGDGTAAHPALFNRDVLAVLPFQTSDHRFVVPVYVMTRNLAKNYAPDAPQSDVTRYDLPPERYQLTIGGTRSADAKVAATDPLTGASVDVKVVSRSGGKLVVELEATDSPRLLTIDDAP